MQTLLHMKNCGYKPCSKPFKQYNTLQKYCSYTCAKQAKAIKSIKKQSKKREQQTKIYTQLRKAFLSKPENKWCPVMLQLKNKKVKATTIHHKRGKIGDLLNDTRFWVALSMDGHKYVEENPIWAKKNGYSLNRLDK